MLFLHLQSVDINICIACGPTNLTAPIYPYRLPKTRSIPGVEQ
jgi:hypothetical protein